MNKEHIVSGKFNVTVYGYYPKTKAFKRLKNNSTFQVEIPKIDIDNDDIVEIPIIGTSTSDIVFVDRILYARFDKNGNVTEFMTSTDGELVRTVRAYTKVGSVLE